MVAQGFCKAIEAELQYHKATLQYVSWAAARLARLRRWTDIPPPPLPVKVPFTPKLLLHEHTFIMDERSGEVRCKNCFVGALSPSTLAHLCNGSQRWCRRSSISAWKAEEWFLSLGPHARPLQPHAVGVALAAADAALSSSAPFEPPAVAVADPPAPPPSPFMGKGAAALQEFNDRGHVMMQTDRVCICTVCAGFLVLPHGVPRSLLGACLGASLVPSTRDKQLRKLARARAGLHPSPGMTLD